MEMIVDFLGDAVEHMNNAGNFLDGYMERFIHWLLMAYLKAKLWALQFSYKIASVLIEGLGISALLEDAWQNIDSQMLAVFTYLRIPEGINMLISSLTTRFIMDML